MNILFMSRDLSGGSLCTRLKDEGHSVRLFIDNKKHRKSYTGMIKKINNWQKEIDWVGRDGLIIFDSCGYGEIQDDLRKKGYSVVGGSELGDKLEHDRQYGQKIFSKCGIPTVTSQSFTRIKDAIKFVKNNKGPWVVKQNGHADKIFNYVGSMEDGSDVADVLNNYCKYEKDECKVIDIQKKVEGIEIGVARYFNGYDWIPAGLGPKTYEMGTLMWYESNENNKLYQRTLAKLKTHLQKINFKGDIDINCIVNNDDVYPLEVTTRFGWPATQLHMEIHDCEWGCLLKAVADGKSFDLKYKKGFGVAVLLATPPFPYQIKIKKYSSKGENIYFQSNMSDDDFLHVYFEEVSKNKKGNYFISSDTGFVLHVANMGKTIKEAQRKAYTIIDKIIIPKKFYRNDIGNKFIKKDSEILKKWGWI